jgi:hypothetical protein
VSNETTIHKLLTVSDKAMLEAMERINRRQKRERKQPVLSLEQEIEKRDKASTQ